MNLVCRHRIFTDMPWHGVPIFRFEQSRRINLPPGGIGVVAFDRDKLIPYLLYSIFAEVFIKDGQIGLAVFIFFVDRNLEARGLDPFILLRRAAYHNPQKATDG